jgi:hypothetical protein
METMEKKVQNNTYNAYVPIIKKRDDFDVNITGMSYNYFKNQYKLGIVSDLIMKDNYTLSLLEDKLVVVVSEIREISKPAHIHNIQWNYPQTRTYERIRSMDIFLPGKNFYLIRHYVIPEKSLLQIVLSTYN